MNYKNIIKSRSLRLKLLQFLGFIPDEVMIPVQYWIKLGRKANLKEPKRYTEKLQWYKLYYRNPVMAKCVDKYEVRNYVKAKGLDYILNDCYGIYQSLEEFDFSVLPMQFVLKDTLGGGGNNVFICKDKNEISESLCRKLVNKWISQGIEKVNYGREWVYCNKLHRVIAEKYIEGATTDGVVDWKFFCFNGKVKMIYWMGNRVLGSCSEIGIFDENFNQLQVTRPDDRPLSHKIERPDNFKQMIEIAEILSSDFPHVRVDLYNENEKIIFGELTFFNGSGYIEFVPDSFDYVLGEYFDLPTI